MFPFRFLSAVLCALAFQPTVTSTTAPQCKRFDVIYKSGKELCENMWDGAFKYETDESKAYTQWFFSTNNPNDDVAKSVGKLTTSSHTKCHLNYWHKDTPGPEPENFTECHPWKENACCSHTTVMSATKLKEGYGKEYHWDRCGPLTPECERFFVQEACFYECDPNAGLYRKWHPSIYNSSNSAHNEWQMSNMPIKASYCDAWFTACRSDKFCASGGGSYFSCAAEYKKVDAKAAELAKLQADLKRAQEEAAAAKNAAAADLKRAQEEAAAAKNAAAALNNKVAVTSVTPVTTDSDDGLGTGVIVGFIVAGVIILALCMCACILVMKEKAGKPLFANLEESSTQSGGGQVVGNGEI
jgi:folate receptor